MRAVFFLLRVGVVAAVTATGVLLALSVPGEVLYAERATSFDTVFGRMEDAMLAGGILGALAGIAAASVIGRRRLAAGPRRIEAVLAALTVLMLWETAGALG